MKIKDIFLATDKPDVLNRLVELYPDQAKNLPGYDNAFQEIQTLCRRPDKPAEGELLIAKYKLSEYQLTPLEEGEEDVDVHDVTVRINGVAYAMEFMDWEEVANLPVAEDTMTCYTVVDILSHLLHEMTFMGYSNDAVAKERTDLEGLMQRISCGQEELVPWEEVSKEA